MPVPTVVRPPLHPSMRPWKNVSPHFVPVGTVVRVRETHKQVTVAVGPITMRVDPRTGVEVRAVNRMNPRDGWFFLSDLTASHLVKSRPE
jgi:hypothetical protein